MKLIRVGNVKIPLPPMRALDWIMFGALAVWFAALLLAGKMEPGLAWTGSARKQFYEKLPYWDFRALSALGIHEDDSLDPRPFLKQMKKAGITFSEGEFKDQLGVKRTVSQVAETIAHVQAAD